MGSMNLSYFCPSFAYVCEVVCVTNLCQSCHVSGLQLYANAAKLLFIPKEALHTLSPAVTHSLQTHIFFVYGNQKEIMRIHSTCICAQLLLVAVFCASSYCSSCFYT